MSSIFSRRHITSSFAILLAAWINAAGAQPYAYNTTQGNDNGSLIASISYQPIAMIGVDSVPEGIAYPGSNHRIYVASWGDNTVSVIDASSNKRLASIPTGEQSRAFGPFIAAAPH